MGNITLNVRLHPPPFADLVPYIKRPYPRSSLTHTYCFWKTPFEAAMWERMVQIEEKEEYEESLKAKSDTTVRGSNRKVKNRATYRTRPRLINVESGRLGIMVCPYVLRMASAKPWPVIFKPSQTSRVDSASNKKAKAEPCSQLKRVMNWV